MDGLTTPEAKDSLYERDFHDWAMAQAVALRAAAEGRAAALDWENLADEIEALGRREPSKLESRLEAIDVHLLKLACARDADPAAGWRVTVIRSRRAVERLLRANPSFRARLPSLAGETTDSARRDAASELEACGDNEGAALVLRQGPFASDQLFDPASWPGQPSPG